MRLLGVNGVDQSSKACPICGGVLGAQPVERVAFGQQAFSPALEGVQPRFLGVGRIGPLRESRPDRHSVDIAHQAPDELQLSAARLSLCNPLCSVERFDEAFGQVELGASCGSDVEQRFAQGLQCIHLRLALGF